MKLMSEDKIDYGYYQNHLDDWFINLDSCVLNALRLLDKEKSEGKLPEFNLKGYWSPLVLGSGNAFETGKILFEGKQPVFADESTYISVLENFKQFGKLGTLDGAVILSASAGKNAPEIINACKQYGLKSELITCNPDAKDKFFGLVNNVYVFPKNEEPYTYNTSTYGGMIFSHTGESPKKVLDHILDKIKPECDSIDFGDYSGYYLLVPDEFSGIKKMFQIKFEELFGRKKGRDIYTPSFAKKHATDVLLDENEILISFGKSDKPEYEGRFKNSIHFKLSPEADYGEMMMVGYYVIGNIQEDNRPYFREDVVGWCESKGIKPFG